MANLLALTAVALDTNMKCSWTLSGSAFSSVTSMVLTYTDLDTVEWINVPVAVTGTGDYEEVVSGLTAGKDYKVYLTVFGKDGSNANLLKLSEVKYVTAAAPPALPEITILSGPTYLQLLFKDAEGAPYNFAGKNILGFVVSVNDLSANSISGNPGIAGHAAKDFLVSQVKSYTFTATDGETYTYQYVIMPDLAMDSAFEVAITYYDEFGIRPIENITTPNAPALTQNVNAPAFTTYALNYSPITTTPEIVVNWRDPLVLESDQLADLPQRPLKIVRQKHDGESWVDDNMTINLDQNVDLATNFTNNGYSRTSAGHFTYTDLTDLVAGTEYRYIVTMKELEGTTETDATTNSVVALIIPTVALPAAALTLDVNDGSIRLDASFSEIVTNDGGFAQSDFANTDFKLAYGFSGDVGFSYTPITIAGDRVTTTSIERRAAGQEALIFKIVATPKHTTSYTSYTDDEDSQDITSSVESSVLGGNYNTVLPGAVTDFVYKNEVSDATAEASFKLEWSSVDDKVNTYSDAFYRVVATSPASAFTAIFSEADVSRKPAHGFSDIITAVGGKLSYTFDANTSGFFAKGNNYSFTIERVYIDNNTISREATQNVGITETGYLLGPVAGETHLALRMFENPPTPTVSDHLFDVDTDVLSFKLAHALATATHGFDNADTKFKVMIVDSSDNVFFTEEDIAQTDNYTVDMSNAIVGETYTLTVMTHVNTAYLSHTEDENENEKAYYSASTAELDFVKEGPLATSESVISYNSIEGETRGGDLLVEWAAVSDAAVATLQASIYYILSVQDETANPIPPPTVVYLKQNVATNETMFKTGDVPTDLHDFTEVNPDTLSYVYTVATLGHEYSFTIEARYLSNQTGFAPKYITSGEKTTTNNLLAVGDLPNPVVTMDVEHDEEIGDRVRLMMDLTGANNLSGLAIADLKFVYKTDKDLMTYLEAEIAEANIPASDFDSLVKTEIIPISVYTYYRTYSSSENIEEEVVEFLSSGVINTNEAQFNPVRYTLAPQVKKVTLAYSGVSPNRMANIVVTVEANDAEAPYEAVIITDTTGGAYNLTHDRDAQAHFVEVVSNAVDGDYTYAVPDVAVGGDALMLFSFVCNNSKGLGVVRFALAGGLAAGTYVRDVRSSADLNSPFVLA